MKKYNFEGKSFEDAKSKALEELKINEEDLILFIVQEKTGLLKKNVIIEVININDLITYVKETLMEITKLMNIEINLEVRRREKNISIKIFSDNNAILIGKNGRTIGALQTLIRQIISNQIKERININLDIENYKENKIKSIEYIAKKIAKEVENTKIEAKMDSMNSYERRIIHSLLSDNKNVYTVSEGEEPNRYVVIKPREE